MSSLSLYKFGDLYFAGIQLKDKVKFVWFNQEDDDDVRLVIRNLSLAFQMYFSFGRKIGLIFVSDLSVQQTAIANVWYEVLSVLHLMAMLCLEEANYLLLPRKSNEGHQQRVSEGR